MIRGGPKRSKPQAWNSAFPVAPVTSLSVSYSVREAGRMADGFFSKLKDKASKAANTVADKTSGAARTVTDAASEAAGVVADKTKDSARFVGEKASAAADSVASSTGTVADASRSLAGSASAQAGTLLAFLSTKELLKWSESISEGAASIYDKALDAEYLRTHIGGGDHRLFDGGHDVVSAWDRVKDASQDDSLTQEVIGYASALWKDVTTAKGLPFSNVDKASFEGWVDKLSSIPGVNREYLYDLLSFDVFEVLSTGLGAVGILLCLNKDDQRKLSEILGAMGITAIISANPLMGLVVIAVAGYSYFKKKQKLEGKALAKGAAVAGISAALFAVLGLPILVELVIVIVLMALLRKHILDNDALVEVVSLRLRQVTGPVGAAWSRWRGQRPDANPPDTRSVSRKMATARLGPDARPLSRGRPSRRRRRGRDRRGRGQFQKRSRRNTRRRSPGRLGMRRPPRVRWAT